MRGPTFQLNDQRLADAEQHADFCRDVVTALSEP
jgi:hypothetical protein